MDFNFLLLLQNKSMLYKQKPEPSISTLCISKQTSKCFIYYFNVVLLINFFFLIQNSMFSFCCRVLLLLSDIMLFKVFSIFVFMFIVSNTRLSYQHQCHHPPSHTINLWIQLWIVSERVKSGKKEKNRLTSNSKWVKAFEELQLCVCVWTCVKLKRKRLKQPLNPILASVTL